MITWNTEVNAPCAGEILNDDGRSILVQTDWDYPGVASTFGWSTYDVQPARPDDDDDPDSLASVFPCSTVGCDHPNTDGTVDCKRCGVTASQFISAAAEWLADNDGATADDPGYFDND